VRIVRVTHFVAEVRGQLVIGPPRIADVASDLHEDDAPLRDEARFTVPPVPGDAAGRVVMCAVLPIGERPRTVVRCDRVGRLAGDRCADLAAITTARRLDILAQTICGHLLARSTYSKRARDRCTMKLPGSENAPQAFITCSPGGHLGTRIVRVARCKTGLVYQVVGLSGWYSQTSKKCFRSIPLRCSARSMNWAVVTLP